MTATCFLLVPMVPVVANGMAIIVVMMLKQFQSAAVLLLLGSCAPLLAQKQRGIDASIPLQVQPPPHIDVQQIYRNQAELDRVAIENELRLQELRARQVPMPYLGVSGVEDASEKLIKQLGIPARGGARIGDVGKNSPASAAGLKRNDVIVAFNGKQIRGARHFLDLLHASPIGGLVELQVYRKGGQMKIEALLSERPL